MATVRQRSTGQRAERLPRHLRAQLRLSRRQLPEPLYPVAVDRAIEVPAGDGVILLADHYQPLTDNPCPTLLVRTPYGRGFPLDFVYGPLFARQGFHVLFQSCRGTGGSGGELEPFGPEAADGQATVAWLRQQDWFTGALGTIGASYLGYTQWALAADPPPELRAMVVQVSSDDFHGFVWPGGAFALESTLVGVAAMLSMEHGFARLSLAMVRLLRHLRKVGRDLPLADAYPAAFGRRVGFFEQWLAHPDPADPYWRQRRAIADLRRVPPTSLLTGWSDVCLDPTLAAYHRLRDAGREVRLIVGPWNHTSGFNSDLPLIMAEALRWFRAHLGEDGEHAGAQPVRIHVGEINARGPGPGQWRDLPDWPPPHTQHQPWHLHGDRTLARTPPPSASVSSWHYDPAKPTPSVAGPRLDSRHAGPQRNRKLETRTDVLVFTSAPLTEPIEVIGPVTIKLSVRASSPHFDVFARLCDVDLGGRSWNICDGLLRLGSESTGAETEGDRSWSTIVVTMSATAHRFGSGHRLRVQISGGAHPRFARNTGTGDPLLTATRLLPVDIEIGHGPATPGVLSLPVQQIGTAQFLTRERLPDPG